MLWPIVILLYAIECVLFLIQITYNTLMAITSWRFVIHGVVDGLSRTITYANNRAPTALNFFEEILDYQIRSGHGGEKVWWYIIVNDNYCVLSTTSE